MVSVGAREVDLKCPRRVYHHPVPQVVQNLTKLIETLLLRVLHEHHGNHEGLAEMPEQLPVEVEDNATIGQANLVDHLPTIPEARPDALGEPFLGRRAICLERHVALPRPERHRLASKHCAGPDHAEPLPQFVEEVSFTGETPCANGAESSTVFHTTQN